MNSQNEAKETQVTGQWKLLQTIYNKEYASRKETQFHQCKVKRTFALKYAYNHENPKNSYHFIVDSNTGKGIRINFCPWCGVKL